MKAKQLTLFKTPSLSHGGTAAKGKRKTMRPIDTKRALHLVLRSTRARGDWSLLSPRNAKPIRRLIDRMAARFGVRIYNFSNVGNHLHLIVRVRTRKGFQDFLRTIAARIAVGVTRAKKGRALKITSGRKFWDALAFTRVLNWGRDYIDTQIYMTKNLFEGEGLDMLTPSGVQRFGIRSGKMSILGP